MAIVKNLTLAFFLDVHCVVIIDGNINLHVAEHCLLFEYFYINCFEKSIAAG